MTGLKFHSRCFAAWLKPKWGWYVTNKACVSEIPKTKQFRPFGPVGTITLHLEVLHLRCACHTNLVCDRWAKNNTEFQQKPFCDGLSNVLWGANMKKQQ